jgi:hypothetical protein
VPISSTPSAVARTVSCSRSRLGGLEGSHAASLDRLGDAAYEKRSLILTSNLHPARFDTIFPKSLATAAVDRLLHHAHVIVTEGRSHRLTEAVAGRGVVGLETLGT